MRLTMDAVIIRFEQLMMKQIISLSMMLFCLSTLMGCSWFGSPAIASPKTEEPDMVTDTRTSMPTVSVSEQAAPSTDVINQFNASSLEVTGGMVQSGATGFVWSSSLDTPVKGLALSSDEQVTLYSIRPPTDAGMIQDNQPNMLSSSYQSGRIAWKNVDETVRVWDLSQDEEIFLIEGNQEALTGLTLSSGGDFLAIANHKNRVEVWDVLGNEMYQDFESVSWLSNLDFSPDEQLLAGVDTPNFIVRFFDISEGIEIRNLSWTEHASPVLYGAYFSPDWSQLAWVARGSIQLMDPDNGALGPMLNHEDFVSAVAWSPDGGTLASAAAGSVNGEYAPLIYFWDPSTGEKVNTLVLQEPVTSISFSPDGREFAVLSSSGALQVWAVKN